MRFTLLFFVIFITVTFPTSAVAGPAKFERWFPLLSANTYNYTSSYICAADLALYQQARKDAFAHHGWVDATCSYQQQCILSHLREDIKARMSSASVMLGLTPGLLASLGPSVTEVSLLSTERPLLSLLLSFGSPAVFPDRVLKYKSALEILDERYKGPNFAKISTSPSLQALISVMQYILAAGAIANVAWTSWQLGDRTSVTFACTNYYFPLLWTTLPFIVDLPSAVAFSSLVNWRHKEGVKFWSKVRSRLRKEPNLCVTRKQSERSIFDPTLGSKACFHIALILGFLHVTFGIVIYSSLLFIETVDVIAVIWRYMVSVFVCRAILMFELAGMRIVDKEQSLHGEHAITALATSGANSTLST